MVHGPFCHGCNEINTRDPLSQSSENAAFFSVQAVQETVIALLQSPRALRLVLDADAFSAFSNDSQALFSAIAKSPSTVVMTPQDSEFQRPFASIANSAYAKRENARAAENLAKWTLIDKGPDTVSAAPDGRCAINTDGGPLLATAGSGDVLSGIVVGLLSQGMSPFETACAAVFLHGEAGQRLGAGLIAEDLRCQFGGPRTSKLLHCTTDLLGLPLPFSRPEALSWGSRNKSLVHKWRAKRPKRNRCRNGAVLQLTSRISAVCAIGKKPKSGLLGAPSKTWSVSLPIWPVCHAAR